MPPASPLPCSSPSKASPFLFPFLEKLALRLNPFLVTPLLPSSCISIPCIEKAYVPLPGIFQGYYVLDLKGVFARVLDFGPQSLLIVEEIEEVKKSPPMQQKNPHLLLAPVIHLDQKVAALEKSPAAGLYLNLLIAQNFLFVSPYTNRSCMIMQSRYTHGTLEGWFRPLHNLEHCTHARSMQEQASLQEGVQPDKAEADPKRL